MAPFFIFIICLKLLKTLFIERHEERPNGTVYTLPKTFHIHFVAQEKKKNIAASNMQTDLGITAHLCPN